MPNRVEELEATVSDLRGTITELKSTVQGLTDELVETKQRVRELERELDEEREIDEADIAETMDGTTQDEIERALAELEEEGKVEGAMGEEPQEKDSEASDIGDDIIVA